MIKYRKFTYKENKTMDCNKIWMDLQDAIKQAVESEVSYSVHIKPAKAVSFDNSVFVIAVPTSIT